MRIKMDTHPFNTPLAAIPDYSKNINAELIFENSLQFAYLKKKYLNANLPKLFLPGYVKYSSLVRCALPFRGRKSNLA